MIPAHLFACEVCGCAASSSGLGLIPFQKAQIIGISYLNKSYLTTHPGETLTEKDRLQSVDLWGRVNLSERWMLRFDLPLVRKTQNQSVVNGLGDAEILAYYKFINWESEKKPFQILGLAGAGLKMPTGKSNQNFENIWIPNMQAGTGSWDGLFTTLITLKWMRWGVFSETSYKASGTRKDDYRYGNTFSSNALLFREFKWKNRVFIPQLGWTTQNARRDFTEASKQVWNIYSGGKQTAFVVGAGLYSKKLSLRSSIGLPLNYHLSRGYIKPKPTFQIGLFYNLSKSKS
ncbi:MAG: hypothetical protein GC181_08215 [Bacteroidetes bacterium]|nr:hypothetical protein [Bacteroidota bacterium]